MQESNKEKKSDNLYTSTSSDNESHMNNPFIKIQLIDSIKSRDFPI